MRGRIAAWILSDYARYKKAERLYRRFFEPVRLASHYPTDLNLEVTSACNSKCTFCSREELIAREEKTIQHMPIETALKALDQFRKICDESGVPEDKIRFAPVGLGEPLLYPHLVEVVQYARKLFPKGFLHANSNCLSLTAANGQRLIDSGLDSVILSLAYNDAADYRRFTGVDRYASVVRNIENFLKQKGRRRPSARIHIFDVEENRPRFKDYIRHWWPKLNANDIAGLYRHVALTDRSPKTGKFYPCEQLWRVLMVGVDGVAYPCCIGVWDKYNPDLSLGHIMDAPSDLIKKAVKIRQQHAEGDFSACRNCSVLVSYASESRENFAAVQKSQSAESSTERWPLNWQMKLANEPAYDV